jgi:leader peptidase (prepilin peptidase) / N-methyltransferase
MDPITTYQISWMIFWLFTAFIFGCAVGSFLNVCVARLPYEKSLLWPGSRCFTCLQPIAARDNLPVLGYLLLRGRCRRCGAKFSSAYMWIELFTGFAFAGLFYLVMFHNIRDFPGAVRPFAELGPHFTKPLLIFLHHATLLSFLIVVSLCDLRDMEIPLSVTVSGTLVGLVFAVFCPWPYPEEIVPMRLAMQPTSLGFPPELPPLPPGIYPWPVWFPLPTWMPPGGPMLGLATGLAGALAGMILLRGVRFLFGLGRGIEGMGVGDADLMMMAGAFIGWQPTVLAFFISVFPALFLGIIQLMRKGDHPLPFGPSLALGVFITLLGWPWLGPHLKMHFFDFTFLAILTVMGGVVLLITAFLLRLLRGGGRPNAEPS